MSIKRLHLIRHGQSTFNKCMDDYFEQNPAEFAAQTADPVTWWENPNHFDPDTVDAPLTPLGCEQAARLPPLVADMKLDLICVSPLTRALQTCATAFGLENGAAPPAPVIVLPQLAERVNSSCDVGQPAAVLKDAFLQSAAFDFSTVQENWWCHGLPMVDPPRVKEHFKNDFVQRIDGLKAWLKDRPESEICLVCHAVVINQFTGTWVENASVTTVEL